MRVVALLLASAILVAAVTGWVTASHMPTPAGCFEACGFESWVASGFAVIFGLSAVTNLSLLAGTVGQGGARPLGSIVIAQFAVLLCAAGWMVAIRFQVAQFGLLAGLGIAVASIAVCLLTIRAMRLPVA
jgi:hypothetical protein